MKVTWNKEDDSFTIDADRDELNMLQRAIQNNPYEEVGVMWQLMMEALMQAHHDLQDAG